MLTGSPPAAGPLDVAKRARFGSERTAFIRTAERDLRTVGATRVRDSDFAVARDPEFWQKADGDSVARGSRDYARHLVAGPRIVLEPRSPQDAAVMPYYEALVGRMKRQASSRFGFADARFRGLAVARILGRREPVDLLGDGNVRDWYCVHELRVMPKGRWSYHQWTEDKKTFRAWALWDWDQCEWVRPDHPDWYIFHRYQDDETQFYGRDISRPLYWLLHAKSILWEAALDTAERFGAPWILGKVDGEIGGASAAAGGDMTSYASVATAVKDVLVKLRQHNVLVGDKRVSVDLLESGMQGVRFVLELIQKIDHEIRILILGSNLPTSATTGGSFALAEIQDESTRRLVAFDRRLLEETLTDQLLERWHRWNEDVFSTIPVPGVPGKTLADLRPPRLRIADDEVFDSATRREAVGIARDIGLTVRKRDLYAATGGVFNQPGEDDDVVDLSALRTPAGAFRDYVSPVWARYAEGRWGEAA